MNEEIRNKIENFAREKAKIKTENNYDFFEVHINTVRNFALELAEKENADKDVVEIAALLHDVGRSVQSEGHAKFSVKLSEPLLKSLNVPKLDLILDCIGKHGIECLNENNPIEVKIIQSADALSLFYSKEWIKTITKEHGKDFMIGCIKGKCKKITIDSASKIAEDHFKKVIME